MNKKFPPEFAQLCKNPGTKAALVSAIEPINGLDCQNCGGHGLMYIFIAKKGPFQAPGCDPYGDESLKYDGGAYGGRGGWWIGRTYSFPCPECAGGTKQIQREYIYPTQEVMGKLIHPDTQEVLE